jgi:hypothetical protein
MRIFISYNNANREIVQALAADVAALSHHAWFDRELTGGQAWWDRILAEIRGCDVFMFALSSESLESYPCKLEHDYAYRLGKPVLPVLVGEGVSPGLLPPALSKVQFVDYRLHDKRALLAIMKALDALPAAQPPASSPDPPPVPISYLGELKDQIDSVTPLGFEQQTVLVFRLKEALRQRTEAKDGRRLLEQLRRRRDLFAVVGAEIDEALADGPGRSVAGQGNRQSAHMIEPPSAGIAASSTVPAPAPARPVAPHPSAPAATAMTDEAEARDIDVETGLDSVVRTLRRVVDARERWTFMATPHRYVSVSLQGQTIAADATFSDLAEVFASSGQKLKTAGWQKDGLRTAGQMLAGAAVGFSFGTLLFNRAVRDFSVTNVMSRTWALDRDNAAHLRSVAADILNALKIIAPNHKMVTARRQAG